MKSNDLIYQAIYISTSICLIKYEINYYTIGDFKYEFNFYKLLTNYMRDIIRSIPLALLNLYVYKQLLLANKKCIQTILILYVYVSLSMESL